MYAVAPWLRAVARRFAIVSGRDHAWNSMSSVGVAPMAAAQAPKCAGSVTTPNCLGDCAPAPDAVASCETAIPTARAIAWNRAPRRVGTTTACSAMSASTTDRRRPPTRPGNTVRPGMARIFISYRRSDDPGNVGRLQDRLRRVYGRRAVFRDIDSIPAGTRFADVISQKMASCDTLMVIIGPEWL